MTSGSPLSAKRDRTNGYPWWQPWFRDDWWHYTSACLVGLVLLAAMIVPMILWGDA